MRRWSEDELGVLVDMLDDPLRRWLAAGELYILFVNSDLPRLILSRLSDFAKDQNVTVSQFLLRAQFKGTPEIRSASIRALNTESPRPVWLFRGRIYTSYEAVEAFADFKDWVDDH